MPYHLSQVNPGTSALTQLTVVTLLGPALLSTQQNRMLFYKSQKVIDST